MRPSSLRRTQWTSYRLPMWSVWLSIWPFGCTSTSKDLNENLTEKSERPPHCIYMVRFPRVPSRRRSQMPEWGPYRARVRHCKNPSDCHKWCYNLCHKSLPRSF